MKKHKIESVEEKWNASGEKVWRFKFHDGTIVTLLDADVTSAKALATRALRHAVAFKYIAKFYRRGERHSV